MLVLASPSGSAQQSTSRCDCTGLHAGITAELTKGYSEPSVMLSFILLNDSQKKLMATPESWKIVIDGKELEIQG
jgi:hypothetical protein